MEPVYFPFTYVSAAAYDLLRTCFQRTAVYQPLPEAIPPGLKEKAEAGRITIRIPVDTDSDRLLNLLKEYQKLADLHAGHNMGFFKTQRGRVPFFDDTSSHHLSTELKQRAAGATGNLPPDPLFDARVFLAVAQEFDSRQTELQSGLSAYHAMERKFLEELTCAPDLPEIGLGGGPALHVDDPGGRMTEERLRAYARLAREDQTGDRLFVTTSQAMVDALSDIAGPLLEVLRIEDMPFPEKTAVPAFRDELASRIQKLLKHPSGDSKTDRIPEWENGGRRKRSMVLYRLQMTREAFLNACIDQVPIQMPALLPPSGDTAKPCDAETGCGILIGVLSEKI